MRIINRIYKLYPMYLLECNLQEIKNIDKKADVIYKYIDINNFREIAKLDSRSNNVEKNYAYVNKLKFRCCRRIRW